MEKEIEELLLNKGQIILFGPPGTGKTFKAKQFAENIVRNNSDQLKDKTFNNLKENGFIDFITFHPSYGYEEFIERITVPIEKEKEPTISGSYVLMAGIFKNLCKRAILYSINKDFQINITNLEKVEVKDMRYKNENIYKWTEKQLRISDIIKDNIDLTWKQVYDAYTSAKYNTNVDFSSAPRFVMIIDEINRGYISKIFGELITLIEKDKRLYEINELTGILPYSGDEFGIPPNIYIIGTMNTADSSIDHIDIALRRRFGFIEMKPDFSLVKELFSQSAKEALKIINSRIFNDENLGKDKLIGHSFLLQIRDTRELLISWKYSILPLIEEYCQGDYEKINKIIYGKKSKEPIRIENDDIDLFIQSILDSEKSEK